MDELDIKILRALISERAVAPSTAQVSSSLRSIASRLGTDDTTVRYRYKRLEESGSMSGWQLLINPTFLGYRMVDVMVDVQPESGKHDMIRKLKLVQEVAAIYDFYGRAMKILVMYGSEDSRSRTVELISRITNAETMTQIRWTLPGSRTERLTETDVAIIRALSSDARRSSVQVARELGLSPRIVRNRVIKLREENTVFAFPVLKVGRLPGLIPVFLSFSYSNNEVKGTVDRALLSHFAPNYLSAELADPESGSVLLAAATLADVKEYLEWARSQPGIASARADLLTESMMFPEKRTELVEHRLKESPAT